MSSLFLGVVAGILVGLGMLLVFGIIKVLFTATNRKDKHLERGFTGWWY